MALAGLMRATTTTTTRAASCHCVNIIVPIILLSTATQQNDGNSARWRRQPRVRLLDNNTNFGSKHKIKRHTQRKQRKSSEQQLQKTHKHTTQPKSCNNTLGACQACDDSRTSNPVGHSAVERMAAQLGCRSRGQHYADATTTLLWWCYVSAYVCASVHIACCSHSRRDASSYRWRTRCADVFAEHPQRTLWSFWPT